MEKITNRATNIPLMQISLISILIPKNRDVCKAVP